MIELTGARIMGTWDDSIMNDDEYPNVKTSAGTSASELNDLSSVAEDYIDILERKIRSLDPYASMLPWDRPKDTDIAGAKGRWLAARSIEKVKADNAELCRLRQRNHWRQ